MIATNATLKAEQTPGLASVKIMPDFSHRLAYDYEPNCPNALVHDVETMLMRSKGMLSLVIDIHDGSRVNEINPENIQWALMSVIRELGDVFALVSTYRDAIATQQA
jgi:hypothetical protein